jgi:ADP-ribosylglycohydrolase
MQVGDETAAHQANYDFAHGLLSFLQLILQACVAPWEFCGNLEHSPVPAFVPSSEIGRQDQGSNCMFGFKSKLPSDHEARLKRVALALDGLSVGDGFGECFFRVSSPGALIAAREPPPFPWHYTDDTEMALAIVEVLKGHGQIHQDELARVFARRYRNNPFRGYGGMAHKILDALSMGAAWREISPTAFAGTGSIGNGGAMRVAPVGAYFADDLPAVVAQARASAEVTHAHHEGQAGAIAVAVAAAWAWQIRENAASQKGGQLLEIAYEHAPDGETRAGLAKAIKLPANIPVENVVDQLGNGSRVTAPDTVPFALWCAAHYLDNYVEALWTTVSGLGDIDTNCAIVGGVVALAAGRTSIPEDWLEARETLKL